MSMISADRSRRRAGAVALLAATAAFAAGCGSSSSSSSSTASSGSTSTNGGASTTASASAKPYSGPETKFPTSYPTPRRASRSITIGFLNPIAANESLDAMQQAIVRTVGGLGGKTIIKDDQLRVDKQVTDFGQLLAQRVDAIIAYPLDPRALGPSLKQARAAGVPVIGIDVNADTSQPLPADYTSQILQGRDREAYEQVQMMSKANANGKIGIIGIGSPVPALKFLLAREQAYAREAGLNVLGEQDNPSDDIAGGQQAASGLLGKYADMNGIIGYNDPSALGAVAAARTNGNKIVAIGLNGGTDGVEGVKNGRLAGTAQNDSVGLGVQAAYAAYDAATKQGGTLPRTVVRPIRVVTKDTVGSITSWSDQLKALGSGG
ncbi:MAG: hypothetical protein JWQ48_778 [Conexibacter sp.]|nr:hypothetical protein [Conexibacter sp.]